MNGKAAPVPVALDPHEAATLFRSGETMCFVAAPDEAFAATQYHGVMALAVPIPFDDAEAYFTQHPACLYDEAFEGDRADLPDNPANPNNYYLQINLEEPPVFVTGILQKVTMPQPVTPDASIQTRVKMYRPDGTEVGIGGATLSWSTTDNNVAGSTDEDSPNAVIQIRAPGVATIKCKNDQYQIERAIEFTITDPVAPPVEPNPLITDIQIDAEPDAPAVGATTALTAHLYDAAGAAITDPGLLVWTTTDVTHITVAVDPADLTKATATIVADGGAQVICTSPAGSSGSIKINIVEDEGGPAATAAILVDPTDPIRMLAGDGVLMALQFGDGQGNYVPAPGEVTWATTDEGIVTLTPSGPPGLDGVTATAVKEGTAVITGSVADPALSATIDMDVLTRAAAAPPPSTITSMSFTISGWPDTPVGETNSVTALFKNGSNPAPWVSEPQWISSKPEVFAITGATHGVTDSTVNLSAVGPGATSIICIVDGYQGPPVDLTVRASEAEADPNAPQPKGTKVTRTTITR